MYASNDPTSVLLTAEDIGKSVLLRNGNIAHYLTKEAPTPQEKRFIWQTQGGRTYNEHGRYLTTCPSGLDIVKVLGYPKMQFIEGHFYINLLTEAVVFCMVSSPEKIVDDKEWKLLNSHLRDSIGLLKGQLKKVLEEESNYEKKYN